jgi:peptidoglycan/xylan/chitin deacetylase (PgdA/CDA1 family)
MSAASLMYHRVASVTQDVNNLAISPDNFRAHIEYLRQTRRPMLLSELGDALIANEAPDDAIALTFDDGYLDNLTIASPVLSEFECPATFFLTTERLEKRDAFWWDVLEQALLCTNLPGHLTLRISGQLQDFRTADPDERRRSHDELWPILRSASPPARDELLMQLREAAGLDGQPVGHQRAMNAVEIQQLTSLPCMEIGAHTVHHLSLPELSGECLAREISESRTDLERLLKRPVVLFAYPYGDVSGEAVEAVRAAGFRLAVTCEPRPLRRNEAPLLLPRLEAPHGSKEEFAEWLDGATQSPTGLP